VGFSSVYLKLKDLVVHLDVYFMILEKS